MAINAGSVYSELILDASKYNAGLLAAEKQMQNFGSKMQAMGKKMEAMGSSLTKKVTLPITAMGAVAVKVGMDFEAAMSEVAAISGATGDQFLALEAKAKEMGATTKFSASEAAEGLKYMAMAGWDTNQMLDGLDGIMMLAAASGEELGLVSDIVTDALTAFGMEASQAGQFADLLASASSNSNTNVAMMGETFKYVAPLFGSLGYSADDAALAIGLMANAGIKGSQAGTALRGAITRLVKPPKEAADAMAKLGIQTTDAQGNMLPFRDIMVQLREKFADLTDEQKAQYAATIFGQEAMSGMLAIINASPADFEKLTRATRDYDGAAKDMADTMQNNLKGQIVILKSGLEGLALQIYEHISPALSKFVSWLQKVVDWLSNLNPATQKTIIAIAALAAGIGPLLLVGGKLVAITTTLMGVFGGATTAAGAATAATGAMAGGLGTAGAIAGKAALLLNPWVLGIAAATVGGIALYNHLQQEAIPAVELFGEGVSEATKKAVGGFLDLHDQADTALKQLAWSGKEVTDEMARDLVGNFEGMKNQIVSKLEEQKKQALESIGDMVAKSKDMTEKQKEEMIRITTEGYGKQIQLVEEKEQKIIQIIEKSKKEHGKITKEAQQEIEKIQKEMRDTGIRTLSESEEEQLAIRERLRVESGKLSAQQAAEIVQNSKKQKKESIKNAEKEYQDRLKYAAMLRAEGGAEAEKMADKIAEEAERQYLEAKKNAEDMHKDVVKEAKAQAEEHVHEVDWETGEVKTKWQAMASSIPVIAKNLKETVIKNFKEKREQTAKEMEEMKKRNIQEWEQLKQNASQKAQEMKSAVINKYNELKTSAAKAIEEKKKAIIKKWKKLRDDAYTWASNMMEQFKQGILDKLGVIGTAAQWVAERVARYLKHQSPAEAGPMSDSDKWMPNFVQMLADGIRNNAGKVAKESEGLAQKIKDGLDRVNTYVTNVVGIIEKQFQLWTLQNDVAKDSSEYLSKQLEVQREKHEILNGQIEATKEALARIITKYGEASNQALEMQNKLLDLKLAQADLASSINETTKTISKQTDELTKWVEKVAKLGKDSARVAKGLSSKDPGKVYESALVIALSQEYQKTGTIKIGKNAMGTNFWRGGWTWVGEQGPELIELPRGSKVYSNSDSVKAINKSQPMPTTAAQRDIHLHIGTLVADEWGLKQLERKLSNFRIGENNRLGVSTT